MEFGFTFHRSSPRVPDLIQNTLGVARVQPIYNDSEQIKLVLVGRTEADQVLEHGVLAQVSVLQLPDDVFLPGLRGPAAASRSQNPAAALRHPGWIRQDCRSRRP